MQKVRQMVSEGDSICKANSELGSWNQIGKWYVRRTDGDSQANGKLGWIGMLFQPCIGPVTLEGVRQIVGQGDRICQASGELGRLYELGTFALYIISYANIKTMPDGQLGKWRVRQMVVYSDSKSQSNGDLLRYHGLGK